jgi:hypothetical protein
MIGNGFKLISQNIFLEKLNNHSSFNIIFERLVVWGQTLKNLLGVWMPCNGLVGQRDWNDPM